MHHYDDRIIWPGPELAFVYVTKRSTDNCQRHGERNEKDPGQRERRPILYTRREEREKGKEKNENQIDRQLEGKNRNHVGLRTPAQTRNNE